MKKNRTKLNYVELLSEERRKKSKVIALMNNKGGCGKTTTSIALGMHLIRLGMNCMFWDNDNQGNLTQRVGLPDEMHKDKRLSSFFKLADEEDSEKAQRSLALHVKYPNLRRLDEAVIKPGHLLLMAGSHNSENNANAAEKNLVENRNFGAGDEDIFTFFRKNISFYKNFCDYVIVDTAPALEGNILNRLAVRNTDWVICPIDGLEAAIGVRSLLKWISNETSKGGASKPNVLFAMVKYQEDTKNIGIDSSDVRSRNAVHRVMEDVFGDYVCVAGVKEQRKLRSTLAGFGAKTFFSKTHYYGLCKEIIEKINIPRQNIFETITSETIAKLTDGLSKIERTAKLKRPVFKTPVFDIDEKVGLPVSPVSLYAERGAEFVPAF